MKAGKSIHRMPGIIPGQPVGTAPKRIPWRFGIFLVVLGLLVWAYWYFLWSPAFKVETVEVIGIPEAVIAPITSPLKGKNIFRIKATTIEQDIKNIYPPVENASVVRGLPHVIRLHITLRDPAIRWQIGEITYIVDTSGAVFDIGDKESYTSLPKVIDTSGRSIAIGQRLLSRTFLEIVEKIPKEVQERFKSNIESIEITETTVHIDVIISGGLRVRLTTQRPMNEQLDAAARIIEHYPEAKYIDVRVPKRAYWKP